MALRARMWARRAAAEATLGWLSSASATLSLGGKSVRCAAAGVALMGQARGAYTFMAHLKWTPVIALGYALSIWVHLLIN